MLAARHTLRGRVRGLVYTGPGSLAVLGASHGARRVVVMREGALEEIVQRASARMERHDDYVAQFGASSLTAVETPTLALETSRGCWWGQKHHCTFCGLNGEDMQYRSKSGPRAREELDFLVDRHANRLVHVVDEGQPDHQETVGA